MALAKRPRYARPGTQFIASLVPSGIPVFRNSGVRFHGAFVRRFCHGAGGAPGFRCGWGAGLFHGPGGPLGRVRAGAAGGPHDLHPGQVLPISPVERLARAGASPTRSDPEGSSRNEPRLGRCPASHPDASHRDAGARTYRTAARKPGHITSRCGSPDAVPRMRRTDAAARERRWHTLFPETDSFRRPPRRRGPQKNRPRFAAHLVVQCGRCRDGRTAIAIRLDGVRVRLLSTTADFRGFLPGAYSQPAAPVLSSRSYRNGALMLVA